MTVLPHIPMDKFIATKLPTEVQTWLEESGVDVQTIREISFIPLWRLGIVDEHRTVFYQDFQKVGEAWKKI